MVLPETFAHSAPPLYPPRVVPSSEPLPLHRFLPRFIDNPIASWPSAVFDQPVVSVKLGRNAVAWVCDPAGIKRILLDERDDFAKTALEKRVLGPLLGNGLLTSEGADWRWQRQIAAPLFRHHDLLEWVPAMNAAADEVTSAWLAAPGRREIDRDMSKATLAIIYKTLLAGGEAFIGDAIERAQDDYLAPISWEIGYAVVGLPKWVPHPGKRRMRRLERELRASVAALITARRRTPAVEPDLLTRLLAATHPESGEPMSDAQLVDNLLTFYSAGHATTAMALTWTLYLLARSPEWNGRIAREVASVCGSGPVESSHVDRLVETQMVLKEAMRLYPPAPVMSRLAGKDCVFSGTSIAAGTHIVVPIYAVHRHALLWHDPDRFDPERFRPGVAKEIDRYQYLPFGGGPRICIGMAFAMIESTVLLSRFVQRFRFVAAPGYGPEPISRVTLRPRGGMQLTVSPLT